MKDFLGLKTDQSLINALEQAASRGVRPSDRLEQRVSFVYGSMKSNSSVTRDHVRNIMLEQQGTPSTQQS